MSAQPYHHLTSSIEQGVLVLTLTTRKIQGFDVAEALHQEFQAALAAAGTTKVVVNFQHTQVLSSMAFRPLLRLRSKLQEMGGGRVVLCSLSKEIGDVFYTTRMVSKDGSVTALFEMEPNVPAAIARLHA